VCSRLKDLKTSNPADKNLLIGFLTSRCNKDFLKMFLEDRPRFVSSLEYNSWLSYNKEAKLASFLYSLGLLQEKERKRLVDRITWLTCELADSAIFTDSSIKNIFNEEEQNTLNERLGKRLLGSLRRTITAARDRCKETKGDPWSAFYYCLTNVRAFSEVYPSGPVHQSIQKARSRISNLTTKLSPISKKSRVKLVTGQVASVASSRSIFEDVDR
jgi:hypothetical protein